MGKNKNIIKIIGLALLINSLFGGISHALPGDPSFRGTSGYGINLQGMSSNLATAEEQLAEAAPELNLGYVRLGATWAEIESTKGSYNWAELDAQVALAHKYDLRVLMIPYETPVWARPAGAPTDWSGAKYPPADSQDYADFIAAIVDRYAPLGVLDYEIWNEPNIDRFWKDTATNPVPDVAHYVELLRAAYDAAHAVNDDVNIIAGALSPAGDDADGASIAPMTFLAQMYAEGAKNYFDAMSFHPYSYPYLPSTDAQWNAWQIMSTVYGSQQSLRSVMTTNGDADKKIWLTEFGAPTDGYPGAVDGAQFADIMQEAVELHASYDWVGPLFFYAYKDTEPPVNDRSETAPDREPWFGLYNYDGTPKSAIAAMRSVMPTSGQLSATANGQTLSSNMSIASSPLFAGSASSYAAVSIMINDTPVCSTVANALGEWSCDYTGTLANGEYQLMVRATNVNGDTQEQGVYAVYVGNNPTAPGNPVGSDAPSSGEVTNSSSANAVIPGAPNSGAQRILMSTMGPIIAVAFVVTGLVALRAVRYYQNSN